jgi:hypothetical protein
MFACETDARVKLVRKRRRTISCNDIKEKEKINNEKQKTKTLFLTDKDSIVRFVYCN